MARKVPRSPLKKVPKRRIDQLKKLTKLAAILLAAAMLLASLASCGGKNEPGETPSAAPTAAPTEAAHDHDHDEDPAKISIGRVGTVEYTMADYLTIYDQYALYSAYITDLSGLIKEQLTEAGVLLTRCDELGIELTEEDEQSVQQQIDEQIEHALSQMMVDETIEDPEELRKARFAELETVLAEYGYTLDSYKQMMGDDMRKSARVAKLEELTAAEVEFNSSDVEEYYNARLESDTSAYKDDPLAFADAYSAYLQGEAYQPLYTPEGVFNVKHLLIQFENWENVPTEEGVFGDEQNAKLAEVRAALESGISLADFDSRFVSDGAYNYDTAMTILDEAAILEYGDYASGFREHGYLIHEKLVSNYFPGFGEAACVLKYGEDWMPEPSSESSEPAQPPIEQYGIVFHETTDGHRIAEVRTDATGGGIHFIYINEELESGPVKIDMGNENDPVYADIYEACRQEKEKEHFTSVYEQWESATSIEFNDEVIEHYMNAHYGVG